MRTSDLTPELIWKLERLEDLLARSKELPCWLEAIWWAADLFHGGHAQYAHHLLARLRSPPRQQTHAPCPCQRWTHWLEHVPADPEARADFLARLSHQISRAPLTAPPESAMHWAGCPVRAWLRDHRGLTQRPVLPLRCAQRLELQDGGYLPVSSRSQRGDFYIAHSDQGWYLSARAGAMVRGFQQTSQGTWLLRDGDSLWLNGLEYHFHTTPVDILCVHEPGQRCRWTPLDGQRPQVGPSAEAAPEARRWSASAQGGALTLRPEDPEAPTLRLPIATAAADRVERAQLGRRTAWAERWPQRPAQHSPGAARWWPPVRPLDAAPPGNPLEELRQRLYPEHPQHKLPREVFALRRRAWEVGCGPIADDYLEDHLKAWPPPWHKPACPCQSWGRWLKELPTEDLEQERWLETLAQAPCAGLPCAQQARLLGPLPQGEPHGAPPREFPLCGELHLRRGDQGELERAAPQDADLRIYRRGDAWSLQPLRAGAPAVSVQGQPAPGGPLEVLRLSAGQRVQIGAQLWQVAGELLGYLRVEYAWDQALEPVHHALFARDILVGRRAADPQDQRRQWITLREASVSRDHCRLEYALGRFLVSDQRSTGGTFLNGRKLTGKALLRAGRDTLQVGDFHLTLVRALPAQEASGAGQGQDL